MTATLDAPQQAAAAQAADGLPVALDPHTLGLLSQLDPTGANQLVQRVLNTYRASLARLRQQALQAHSTGDAATVKLAVHTLKSSSASVGALRLSALCAEAEQCVREGRLDSLPEVLGRLDAEAARVDEAVFSLLQAPR
ncbi:MAG: Hpt domain-containing protein [Burkholderiaceae bacterium]|nr:Hpt domain-containing protein [Burkholderiaceae bacterium]